MIRKIAGVLAQLPGKTSDALAWLGGANLAIVGRAPTTRGKFVQMGLVLLTTASIAAVAMTFFINHEISEPESTAIVIGVFWGLVILNLDRFLVVSMGATRDKRRLMLMAAPRLCLAIVIALVVSTPITLRLFQSDINNQLRSSHLAESAKLNNLEAKSGLALQAKQLATEISQDQATLSGTLPQTVTNPQLSTAKGLVTTLQAEVSKAYTAAIHAREAWQCELYGDGPRCAGASNVPGNGLLAQAKQQAYEQKYRAYQSLNAQLRTAEHNESQGEASLKKAQGRALARYQRLARAALPGLQKQYNQDEKEITQAQNADQTAINQNTGVLAQLSALWTASAGNPVLMLSHLTVMALFFLIELLPVLVKILLNLGELDPYEKVLKTDEEKVADKVRRERLTERRDAERTSDEDRKKADAASQARIRVAEDKSKREQDLGIRANKYVAERMETILDAALQQWSAQVTATLNNAQGGTQPVGASPPNGAGPMPNGATPTPNGAGPMPNAVVPPQGFELAPPGSKI
jgi:Domain of unknown function (DUF4407)